MPYDGGRQVAQGSGTVAVAGRAVLYDALINEWQSEQHGEQLRHAQTQARC